jgi:hypothetical protein
MEQGWSMSNRVHYDWAKVLNFTVDGNALPLCVSGWGSPEEGLVWTDGLNAKLAFAIKPPKTDVSLILSCSPFLAEGKIPYQEIHVFLNFLRVGFTALNAPAEVEFSIPQRVFDGPEVDIDLYLPKACSPASLGTSPDVRTLGIAVNRLMLIET